MPRRARENDETPSGDPHADGTTMLVPLDEILELWKSDAQVLQEHGYQSHAGDLLHLCADVHGATRDYSTWIDEGEAMTLTSPPREWPLKRCRA